MTNLFGDRDRMVEVVRLEAGSDEVIENERGGAALSVGFGKSVEELQRRRR